MRTTTAIPTEMDAAKKIMQHNIMKHGFTYCGISS
jgi:hypothetical protein